MKKTKHLKSLFLFVKEKHIVKKVMLKGIKVSMLQRNK